MGKGMTKGKHITIYLDPESLEWFLTIQKQWHLEHKDSKTMQTILKMWKRMVSLLNKGLLQDENGLGELVAMILKADQKKKES